MWKVSRKNHKQRPRILPPPPVVSTYCSRSLKPRLFLHNFLFCRATPNSLSGNSSPSPSPSPSPAKPTTSNSLLARAYLEKIRQLEEELADLDNWLNSSLKNNNNNINNNNNNNNGGHAGEVVSLEDGNCIKKLRRGLTAKKSQELAIQMSALASVEEGTTISEVLTSMASIGMGSLIETLMETIPLSDITGSKIDDTRRKSTAGRWVRDEIIDGAMEMIEELAAEGLKIHHASNKHKRIDPDRKMMMMMMMKEKKKEDLHHVDVAVHVMLIQIRDAMKHFEEVGDPMIALVEVSTGGGGGRKESKIEGVCVAGLTFDDELEDDGFIWSLSWMDPDKRPRFLRNRDIVCPKKLSTDFVPRRP